MKLFDPTKIMWRHNWYFDGRQLRRNLQQKTWSNLSAQSCRPRLNHLKKKHCCNLMDLFTISYHQTNITNAVNNVCDISISQFPQPLIKGDWAAITIRWKSIKPEQEWERVSSTFIEELCGLGVQHIWRLCVCRCNCL